MITSYLSDAARSIGSDIYVPDQLDTWLATHGLNPPDDVRGVLRNCGSPPEILFALGFTSLPGFHVDGFNSFRADGCSLVLQYPIAQYRADFLLRVPDAGRPTVIEIDGRQWHHVTIEQRRRDMERQRFIEGQRFRVRRIAAIEAERFGKKLWLALNLDLNDFNHLRNTGSI